MKDSSYLYIMIFGDDCIQKYMNFPEMSGDDNSTSLELPPKDPWVLIKQTCKLLS